MSIYSHDVFDNIRTRVVVVANDAMLLLRPRTADQGWLAPGGGIHHGESLFECAAREVLEETGVTVDPIGIVFIREWIVPRFAQPIPGDNRTGYGIEAFVWASPCDITAMPRPESTSSRVPEWVQVTEIPQLPIWPVELKELAVSINSGSPIGLTPSVIGRLQPPTDASPAMQFAIQVKV